MTALMGKREKLQQLMQAVKEGSATPPAATVQAANYKIQQLALSTVCDRQRGLCIAGQRFEEAAFVTAVQEGAMVVKPDGGRLYAEFVQP